jgi:aminoglycoside phosphotransferase (APT) family kinase protein
LARPIDRRPRDAGVVDGPVRVGDTVRRARSKNTALVQRVLGRLEEEGVAWAPRALGIDELGREVLSWIAGDVAASGDQVDVLLLAGVVRQLHDLTAALVDGYDCVIHDDLQPRNVVVRGRIPIGLIDWEQARPGRRVEDVAKLCWSFVEPTPTSDPVEIGARWRQIVDAYRLERPDILVSIMLSQMQACADDIEREMAQGSVRHQALAARGDHVALRAMHAWTVAHELTVRKIICP